MTDPAIFPPFDALVSKAQRPVACNRGAILQGMG